MPVAFDSATVSRRSVSAVSNELRGGNGFIRAVAVVVSGFPIHLVTSNRCVTLAFLNSGIDLQRGLRPQANVGQVSNLSGQDAILSYKMPHGVLKLHCQSLNC